MTRALLIQALGALDTCSTLTSRQWFAEDRVDAAREALQTHLSQPQSEPLFAGLIAQHEGLSEELREMDKPQAMTDREAYERWARLYGAPMYYEDLDEYSESAWRVWQAAKATGPAWHDAPNAPGRWVSRLNGTLRNLDVHDIDHLAKYGHSGKWYGPIPPLEDK